MKHRRLFIVLAAVLLCAVLLLVSCTSEQLTPEEKVRQAAQNLSEAENFAYDMVMVTDMTADGEELVMDMHAEAAVFHDPLKLKMLISMEVMGVSMDTELYALQEGNSYVLYTGTPGHWKKERLSPSAFEERMGQQADVRASVNLYLENAGNFIDGGTEEVEGVTARRIQGFLSEDSLREVMEASGALENAGLTVEAISEDLMKEIAQNIGELPITVWLDEERMLPAKYELDMTELMQGVFDEIFKELGTEAKDFSVGNVFISMTLKDVGAAEEFDLPEEALDAPEVQAGAA